ncbi:MAG: hypothetical protein HY815_17265 [Candidatus Riflebacteria bacterium]|nr:hypothetical protein [Candidatus Riflebacteria bacterium]
MRRRIVAKRLLAGLVGTGLSIVTAVLAGSGSPEPVPLRFWGQVLGEAPRTLEAVMLDSSGTSTLLTAGARMARTTSATFYLASFPRRALDATRRDAGDCRFGFRSGPSSAVVSSVPIPADTVGPVEMHCRALAPVLPDKAVAFAQVVLRSGPPQKLVFLSVIANRGTASAGGRLSWTPAAPSPLTAGSTSELAAAGLTVCRLERPLGADARPPIVWKLDWFPDDPAGTFVHGRAILLDSVSLLVDRIGEGPGLPVADPLVMAGGWYPLTEESPKINSGHHLRLEMECSLATEAEVRAALKGFALRLGGPDAPRDAGDPGMAACRVIPVPGGRCWVSARWFFGQDVQPGIPDLGGPPGKTLPGSWIVRRLDLAYRHGGREAF